MDQISVILLALIVPITVGVVEVFKQTFLSSRWAGLVALFVGIIVGIVLQAAGFDGDSTMAQAAVAGIVGGLTAAGVWSAGKHVVTGH